MEDRKAVSSRKGKSIQKTSPLVYRAVEVLMPHFRPLEIKKLLNLKRRTCYHLIQKIKQKQHERRIAREEMRAEVEREIEGVNAASLRAPWQSAPRLRDVRNFKQ